MGEPFAAKEQLPRSRRRRPGVADRLRHWRRSFTKGNQGVRRARCVHSRDFSAAQAMVYERLQIRPAFGLRYILGGVAVGLNPTQMMARTRCPLRPDRCWPV